MKKIIFITALFFILGFEQGFAQHKYKLEYDLMFYPMSSEQTIYQFSIWDNGGTDRAYIIHEVWNGNQPKRITEDVVITSRNIITSFYNYSYYWAQSTDEGCDRDSFVDFTSYCINDFTSFQLCFVPQNYSKVFTLIPLPDDINSIGTNHTSNPLNTCESKTIDVTTAADCELSYSVVAVYDHDNNVSTPPRNVTILPYERHSNSFTFNYSDFPELPIQKSFTIQVNYVQYPQNDDERSDLLTFSYTDCSPALSSGPTAINTQCSYSDDGSFTAQFDRVLDASKNERMLVYVEKKLPNNSWDSNISYIVPNTLAMSGNNLTWPSELETGTYRLRWISKHGTDPTKNPNSDEMSGEFTIGSPSALQITSVTPQQANCPSDTGSITINATGGTGALQYSINNGVNWQSSNSFPNLAYGSTNVYTIRVRDVNNCLEPDPSEGAIQIVLEVPNASPQIDANPFAVTQPTVNGGSWAININSSGGATGSHTYQWTKDGVAGTYATTQDITGTGEGTYRVTAFDSRGCPSISVPFTIIEPELMGIIFTEPVPIICNGGRGSIRVQGTGGVYDDVDSYTYSWTDDNSTNQLRSNIIAGIYEVTIRDKNNNVITQSYELTEPDAIVVTNIIPTDVLCTGNNTGSIALTIEGGTGSFNVIWSKSFDPGFTATGTTLTGLTAGTYSYTVSDAANSNCSITNSEPIELTEPLTGMNIVENVSFHVNNIIFGGNIGELSITVSGGTEPYKSILWSNLDDSSYTGSGISLINLKAGRYQVVVTDNNDCTISLENPIIITEPNLLDITSATPTPVNCYGESTGGIKLSVSGGIGPYHYQWSKQGDALFTGLDTDEITDLSIGLYDVVVTDSSGSVASTSTSVEVTQNTEIAIMLNNQQNNICYNDNQGSINITVTGGTAPYTYQWSNGTTSEDINTLQTGSYGVVVTDVLGCTTSGSYEITQPAEAVSISDVEVTQISANGYNDGAINLTISGGATPYTFDWFADNGFTSTSEDIANLAPGHYTVIVFDGNYTASGSSACAAVQEFDIIEPDVLEVNITEELNLLCYGDTDGEIMANVSGGVPPYRYAWYRVAGTTTLLGANTALIDNLGTGSYQVVVTDVNNIEATSEIFNLSEPSELLLEITSATHVLCYGESTGAIDMQITGGTTPYYINWSQGATTEDLQNIPAGTYTITVEDTNGCIKEQTVSILNVNEALQITTSNLIDVTSFDGTDGSLSIAFTGGGSPHNIEWIKISTGEIVGTTTTINNLTADDYRVTIEDANGCRITEIYTITQPDVVVANIANATCVDSCDGAISLVVDQGNGIYTYTWSNGSTSSNITNLCAGTYKVAIGGYGNGNRILERTYEIIDPEVFVIDIGDDRTLCEGQTHEIDATINDAGASYQWTSDNGFTNTTPLVKLNESGMYTLTITNSLGCQATDTIIISRTVDVISSEFAISSQVFTGESVVVVNISNPTPDSVKWILPEAGEIIEKNSDFAEMVFNAPGEYSFGMITRLGDCEAYQEKTVVVIDREELTESEEEQKSERIPSIIEFKIYPNPSSGQFTLDVELKQIQNISLKVFALTNNSMVDFRVNHNKDKYTEYYDLSRVASGMYFILIETPTTTQIKKIIID